MALSGPQKTVSQTVGLVVVMGGLAWASVPFYDWFCRVTGFGGTPGISETADTDILDQTITVRFDASLDSKMPWEFKPVERELFLSELSPNLAAMLSANACCKIVKCQHPDL